MKQSATTIAFFKNVKTNFNKNNLAGIEYLEKVNTKDKLFIDLLPNGKGLAKVLYKHRYYIVKISKCCNAIDLSIYKNDNIYRASFEIKHKNFTFIDKNTIEYAEIFGKMAEYKYICCNWGGI